MKRLYYILLLVIFIFTACRSNEKDTAEIGFSESKTLQDGIAILRDCEPIENMVLCDSLLWLSGTDGSELLHVYSLSGEPVAAGIAIGQGGDDVLEVSSMRNVNGRVYIYDSNGGVITDITCANGKLNIDRVAREMRLYDDAILLPDSSALVLPLNSANAYALLNHQNRMTDSLSYFPPKPTGISDETHHLACTGMLAYSSADTTFARTLAYDGGIDFFSIRDGRIIHKMRYANFDMVYSTFRDEGMLPVPSDESRVGYSYIYATPKHFYAAYSEQKSLDNPDALSSEIHVFDHNGKPQYKIVTEKPLQAFAVSEDDSCLYVAEVDKEDSVTVKLYMLCSKSDK